MQCNCLRFKSCNSYTGSHTPAQQRAHRTRTALREDNEGRCRRQGSISVSRKYQVGRDADDRANVLSLKTPSHALDRSGRALMHWLNATDVRAAFYASSVTSPADVGSFWKRWEDRRTGAGIQPMQFAANVEQLPTELAGVEQAFRAT